LTHAREIDDRLLCPQRRFSPELAPAGDRAWAVLAPVAPGVLNGHTAGVGEGKVELVRRAFEAFTARDVEALLAVADPDVEFLAPTGSIAGHGTPYRGHDGLREYFEDVSRIWEELEVIPHEFREVGDQVVALGRVYGRGLDGLLVDSPTGWVWTVENGKIVAGRVYTNRQEALDAVGLHK
jgi:ketosteroid isomerase-like protein